MISFEAYFHLMRPSCRVEVNMSKWLQIEMELNLKDCVKNTFGMEIVF